jgi:phosphoserine phosphatase RsbU/P
MADSPVVHSSSERIARVIFEHASRISRQNDISTLVVLTADLARDLIGAERCSLWLVDEKTGELWTRVAHGTGEIRIPRGVGIVGACLAQGEPIIVNDVHSDSRFFSGVDDSRGYQTHSVACVPLQTEKGIIGALQLLNRATNTFSAEDAELLRFTALYAGSAIQAELLRQETEAARLLRHELNIAAEVQSKLFPQIVDSLDGLECTGFCRPAKFVSGDYYDFLKLPAGEFALTLGDVSGKGLPAAMLMASIHMLLRSLLIRNPNEIARVVEDLNGAIQQSSSADRYSTLFCGVLNAARDKLTFVNAGHIAPVIVRGDGRIERPMEGDLPVGLLPEVTYQQHSINLCPGDLLVCVSDGVLEVQNASGEFVDIPIENILRENRTQTIEKIAESVFNSIQSYAAGAEQFDDITIVIVRIVPD